MLLLLLLQVIYRLVESLPLLQGVFGEVYLSNLDAATNCEALQTLVGRAFLKKSHQTPQINT